MAKMWDAPLAVVVTGDDTNTVREMLFDQNGDLLVVATRPASGQRSQLYLAKYSHVDGSLRWEHPELGAPAIASIKAQLDGAGDLYVVGCQSLPVSSPFGVTFAAKYDNATGALLWSAIAQGDPAARASSVEAIDVNAAGELLLRASVEDTPNTNVFQGDGIKLSASGQVLWDVYVSPRCAFFGPDGNILDSNLRKYSAATGAALTPQSWNPVENLVRVFGSDVIAASATALARYRGSDLTRYWSTAFGPAPSSPETITDFQLGSDGASSVVLRRPIGTIQRPDWRVLGFSDVGERRWEHTFSGSTERLSLLSPRTPANGVFLVARQAGYPYPTHLYRLDAATGAELTHFIQPEDGLLGVPVLGASSGAGFALLHRWSGDPMQWRLTYYRPLPAFTSAESASIAGRQVTLHADLDAGSRPLTVSYEWGPDPDHTQPIAALPNSTDAVLEPIRAGTYYYRAIYHYTGLPTIYGAGHTLEVPNANEAPVANPDTFTTTMSRPILLDVLANDTDADSDPLTLTDFRWSDEIRPGNILWPPAENGTFRFQPSSGFSGTFEITYTIADDHGGTSTGHAAVTVDRPKAVSVRVLASTGSKVADYDDTYFQHFSAVGDAPFFATVKSPNAKYGAMLVSREGTVLGSFRNQVIGLGTPSGLSFTGRILDDGRGERAAGLFRFDGTDPIALAKVGQPAPGAEPAFFRKVIAYDGTGPSTFFLATLGGEGVTPRNDLALFAAPPGAPARLIARKGMPYFNANTESSTDARRVVNISTLVAYPKTPAEGRWVQAGQSFGVGDKILVRLTREDGAHFACFIPADSTSVNDWVTCMTTDAADSGGITSIGPVSSGPNSFGAVVMRKRTPEVAPKPYIFYFDDAGNDTGWYVPDDQIARDIVCGGPGKFAVIFQAPWVLGYQTLETHDVNYPKALNSPETVSLRTYHDDTPVPGVGSGARFADFTSVTYLDGPNFGLAFTAEMQVGRGGVTGANKRGIWAQDSKGKLRLVLRQGQVVQVGGRARTIARFVALQTAANVTGTSRGTDPNGVIYAHAYFTDATEAALELTLP